MVKMLKGKSQSGMDEIDCLFHSILSVHGCIKDSCEQAELDRGGHGGAARPRGLSFSPNSPGDTNYAG
jgi:hypothetical protein